MDKINVKMQHINIFAYMVTVTICLLLYPAAQFIGFDYIYFLCLGFCICYCVSLACFIKTKGVASISCLFWICLFAFAGSRPFLYVFGTFNFMNAPYSIMGDFLWTTQTAITVIAYYIVFMGIFSAIILSEGNQNRSAVQPGPERTLRNGKDHPFASIHQILYIAYYVTAPIILLFYLIQALMVVQYGYVSLYNGKINEIIPFAGAFSIARLVFTVSYYAILSFEKREKHFLIAASLFLVINAVQLIQGSRAGLITAAFTFLVLYCVRFKRKFKLRWLIIVLLLGIPILEMISYVRSGVDLKNLSIAESYSSFFSALSGSFNVPAYYLQNKEALSFNTYPYIMEPIVKLIQYYQNVDVYSSGQTQEMINIRYNLGHQISYHILPGYYLQGNNVASNFIAEMAEFGIVGVIVFSAIFAGMIRYVENAIRNQSPFICYMSVELCTWIFMAPRASVFYDTYNLVKWGLIYFFLLFVGSIFTKNILRRKS